MTTIAENVIFAPLFTKLVSAKNKSPSAGIEEERLERLFRKKNLPKLGRLLERFQQ